MAIQYQIDIPEIEAVHASWAATPVRMKELMRATLTKSAITVQSIAKEEAPVKTGRMRSAITFDLLGDTKALIRANTNYAEFVERGTGLYGPYRQPIVRPNGGIMWSKTDPGFGAPNSRGYWFIGKSVKGQQSNPFMRRAYERSTPLVVEEFRVMLQTLAKEL